MRDSNVENFNTDKLQVLIAMEYHCEEYDCIVTESPCPFCGSTEHDGL